MPRDDAVGVAKIARVAVVAGIGVEEVGRIMLVMAQKNMFTAASGRLKRSALPVGLFMASFAMFVTAFVEPAPALDAPAATRAPETMPLPMFKNPRAALRAGLESYHAGNAGASVVALRYAAEGGEPLAQWKLGRMYAEGDGVTRDDAKAYDYFSRIVDHFAEEEPDPRERSMAANAFVSVGLYLKDGLSSARIEPDLDRAFELFRYAATYFRNADAQYQLARMYLDGVGVKKDMRQSVNWLELAARKGHPQAQAVLGGLMFSGEAGGNQKARGLMYLTLARDAVAGSGANDQWIIESYTKAVAAANEADRRATVVLLEDYLRERN